VRKSALDLQTLNSLQNGKRKTRKTPRHVTSHRHQHHHQHQHRLQMHQWHRSNNTAANTSPVTHPGHNLSISDPLSLDT
jgi:hypothetical protein